MSLWPANTFDPMLSAYYGWKRHARTSGVDLKARRLLRARARSRRNNASHVIFRRPIAKRHLTRAERKRRPHRVSIWTRTTAPS